MSRKDYELVAEALRLIPAVHREPCARKLALAFYRDNPRFRPATFFDACGLSHLNRDQENAS